MEIGRVGKRLFKRGIVPLVLKLAAQGSLEIQRYAVEILQTLTRLPQCRSAMLSNSSDPQSQKNGLNFVERFLGHTDAEIVSQTILLTVHLLWDEEWRPLIISLNPEVECIAAKWACAALNVIHAEIKKKREIWLLSSDLSDNCPNITGILNPSAEFQEILQWQQYWDAVPEERKHMGKGMLYPIKNEESKAMLLLSRCVLLLCSFTPLHCDMMMARMRSVHALELFAACIDLESETSSFATNGLANFAVKEQFLPTDVPDPQIFVDIVLDIVLAYRDQRTLTPQEAKRANGSVDPNLLRLLGHVLNSSEKGALPHSDWKKYISTGRHKVKDYIPDNSYIDTIFGVAKQTAKQFKARIPQLQKPAIHFENKRETSPETRACANPSCTTTKQGLKDFKYCSRCRVSCYCSKQCQAEHWRKHKATCKLKL